jgi:hypothetical protein
MASRLVGEVWNAKVKIVALLFTAGFDIPRTMPLAHDGTHGDESEAAAATPSAALLFLRHQKWFTCH